MESGVISLPKKIEDHLKGLAESLSIEDGYDALVGNWIKKDEMFDKQTSSLDMISVPEFSKDDKRAVMVLTYSGSLISVSTMYSKSRTVEYASIKLRSDVPGIIIMEKCQLAEDVKIDANMQFINGEIHKTSSVYKIMTFDENIEPADQDKRLREAVIYLTNAFVRINRTTSVLDDDAPEQFNMKSMVNYIAEKNAVSQKLAKQILEDYHSLIEVGMMLDERVSLGKLGSLSIKKKEAQGARVIKNPATGEDMTVSAKPERFVPKISFSKLLKDKISQVETETE
ncbi:MAG: HU family DNA-binding protein [Spirochaetes bacterium]|nr:HU family DNA-binding protein [Spirochaetota bacterium]